MVNMLNVKRRKMNVRNITSLFIGVLLLFVTACEPIEDRNSLSNSFDPDNIELEVIQSTPGGNGLSIRMNTPGITGYWDYNIDKKFTDRVDVNYPIPGVQTFTYHVTTAYMPNGDPADTEYISKSIDVEIDVLDQPLAQAYYDLIGDDLGGKTWVFDGVAGDGGGWWFMSDPGNPWGLWWDPVADGQAPSDSAGKMLFDLDGAANYTYYATADGTGVTGSSFKFNATYTKFYILGDSNILGSMDGGGNSGEFNIVELTADKMVLHVPNAAWSTGWTWVFVPEQ